MEVRPIDSSSDWEKHVAKISFVPFTQSWVWGEFQKSLGKRVLRLAVDDRAWCQIIFESRPLVGGYWFAPKGPVFADGETQNVTEILEALKTYARAHLRDGVFLRTEPPVGSSLTIPAEWKRKKSFDPSSTRRLGLTKSADDLLADMHQKTRYNIRLSEKKTLDVRVGNEADLRAFLALLKETAARGNFSPLADTRLKSMYDFLAKDGTAKLRLVEYDGKLIAGQLEIWYADTVTYLHGASSSSHRELMAPYALHWHAIAEAKADGKHWYDFWGENPNDETSIDYKPKWSGISRFKKGFGGEHIEYVGTLEVPIKKTLYAVLHAMRRI